MTLIDVWVFVCWTRLASSSCSSVGPLQKFLTYHQPLQWLLSIARISPEARLVGSVKAEPHNQSADGDPEIKEARGTYSDTRREWKGQEISITELREVWNSYYRRFPTDLVESSSRIAPPLTHRKAQALFYWVGACLIIMGKPQNLQQMEQEPSHFQRQASRRQGIHPLEYSEQP